MSRNEFFRGLPELADMIWIMPGREHIDAKGVERVVTVLDQRAAMDALADVARPNVNLLGAGIWHVLSSISDGYRIDRCAICARAAQ